MKARAPEGYRALGSYHGFTEYELAQNGLRVLYRHDDTVPVAGLMVTYLVGSRNEATGHTGATHLLEHLMFKGSKRFPVVHGRSTIDLLQEKGALLNATTWLDRTNYYEVLPEAHFEHALMIEADRMRHALITQKDLTDEMPAVRSEYAMGENDPMEALDKHLWATAFLAHPYHHSTIGWLSDIETVPLEKLKHFYDTYYWPNNAYVTVISNMTAEDALALIRKHFGVHHRSPHAIPQPYTTEPPQTGPRFVEVRRAGEVDMVGIAYKVPEALHADTAALEVISSVLADGRTSRLYRALVEKGLCSSVRGVYFPFKDPSLMTFFATLTRKATHERVAQVMRETISGIASGVTREELARTIAHVETDIAFARDGHFAMLSALNEAIAVGDWRFFFDLPARVGRVTKADITRVAARYLTETSSTTGYYRALRTVSHSRNTP